MSEQEKKRQEQDEEMNEEQAREEAAEEKAVVDPAAQLKELCRGKLKLMFPFRAHSQDVEELEFDMCALSGREIATALDSVPVNNMFAITNEQAIAIFAASAAKNAPYTEDDGKNTRMYDAKDIRDRISGPDFIKAVQLAKLFYNASSRAGNNNISKG